MRCFVQFATLAGLLAATTFSGGLAAEAASLQDLNPISIDQTAGYMQADGAMAASDYRKLAAIHNNVVDSGGHIADTDLAFLMHLLDKPSQWPGESNFSILATLDLVSHMTNKQEAIILQRVEPLASFPEGVHDLGNTRMMAARVLGTTRDAKAIPFLLPLRNDHFLYVKRDAVRALKKVRYAAYKIN